MMRSSINDEFDRLRFRNLSAANYINKIVLPVYPFTRTGYLNLSNTFLAYKCFANTVNHNSYSMQES